MKGLAVDDQGWYECRILMLDTPTNQLDTPTVDTPTNQLQNGTWTLLTVTGQLGEGLIARGRGIEPGAGPTPCKEFALGWL